MCRNAKNDLHLQKIFCSIAVFVASLCLAINSFAKTYLVSTLQKDSYVDPDNSDNIIYSYDLSQSDYTYKYFMYKAQGANQGQTLYSRSYVNTVNAPLFLAWNVNKGNEALDGTVPSQYNFDGLLVGNTVKLDLVMTLGTTNQIPGYGYCYLLLFNHTPSYSEVWNIQTGGASATIASTGVVADVYQIQVGGGSNPQTIHLAFDFLIETYTSNLFPVIAWSVPQGYQGNLISSTVTLSRSYPSSGIIVHNTDQINTTVNDIDDKIVSIQGDMTVIKNKLTSIDNGLDDINDSINHLESTLTQNGQTPEFSTDETLPVDDIEDANNGIESAQANFNNFFADYFLHSNVGAWFTQLWDTLLDSSGVGTPFLFLTPAALFLIVRSLFGR